MKKPPQPSPKNPGLRGDSGGLSYTKDPGSSPVTRAEHAAKKIAHAINKLNPFD